MKLKLPLISYHCTVDAPIWPKFDILHVKLWSCFSQSKRVHVITMEFGQLLDCKMMDICLFQERAWCCSYAAPEWLEWRRGAVLLQLERLQVPGGGRSNRDGHLEDKQFCPGKKPLKVLKRNLSQTVKVQSFMCSYGRVPMVSEAFFACNPVNVKSKYNLISVSADITAIG